MKKIKTGDPVIVIAGKHKGKVSTVKKVDGEKVFLDAVNEVKKAVKGKGFQTKTLPIHVSNCMYYNEKEKKGSRIGIQIDKEGKKKRVLKKFTNITID
jgi:large subunit ribosomal protein L24